jgi:hypothetical protein
MIRATHGYLVLPTNFTSPSPMQFNALSVQQTIFQCADAGGYAWLPRSLDLYPGLQRHFFLLRKPMPKPDKPYENPQGLCIEKTDSPCTKADTTGGAGPHFREQPGTIAQCAGTGGFAWWPLLQPHDAGPSFLRMWNGMPPAPPDIRDLQGKCVMYVTVCMFPRSPTHWPQRNV